MKSYHIIGLMSGTSMDGIDISYARYNFINNTWDYQLIAVQTYPYDDSINAQLSNSKSLTVPEILMLDKQLGAIYAERINAFVVANSIDSAAVSAIASHGHTIFHQPEKGFTYQIGCGDTIAHNTGIPVINDFRQKDVIAGGQGAPLVPIGDQLLFSKDADAFLNIGGFCNITLLEEQIRAFDICPGNLPINQLVSAIGKSFDHGGTIAASGTCIESLLTQLNALEYYHKSGPKSLGTEWLDHAFMKLMPQDQALRDVLRTLTEHISDQIARIVRDSEIKRLMISGGGVHNAFLIERIRAKCNTAIIIPEKKVIDYKEALIFGLLGALFLEKIPNCIPSVTGASKAVIGGVFHLP